MFTFLILDQALILSNVQYNFYNRIPMDQLSIYFQERQQQALQLDITHPINQEIQFSSTSFYGQAQDHVYQCELEPQDLHSPCSTENATPFQEDYAQSNDIVAMPLDVPRSTHQIFLASLQSETNKALSSFERHELNLKICRAHKKCVICQQQIKRKSIVFDLKCRHYFHHKCLKKWHEKHNTCPLCRKQLR